MLDGERRLYARYCDDVEADRQIDGESFYVSISCQDNAADFSFRHSFLRETETGVSPGFHFDDDQFSIFFGNDVQLQFADVPVSVPYPVSS